MLGQIANFCPVISHNAIVKNSTSVKSIWQDIRAHYGSQSTGAHFLSILLASSLTPMNARTVSRRVSTKQSPHFKAFYKYHPLRLTLDTGAETSMIKSSVARSIGAPTNQSSQHALQADAVTPLALAGEAHLILSRADKQLALDALVLDDLDVDILVGTPFLIANDITVRPAKCQVRIQDSGIIHYEPTDDTTTGSHAVRRAQNFHPTHSFFRDCCVAGEYLELDIPPNLGDDRILALQPRTDTPISKHTKPSHIWPEPQILEAVGSKIRLVNTSKNHRSPLAPKPDPTHHRRTVTYLQPDTHRSTVSRAAQVFTTLFVRCVRRSWQLTLPHLNRPRLSLCDLVAQSAE